MIDIQSPADGAEMLVAPDFPVALVVAAVPVLVLLKENKHSCSMKEQKSR